MPRKVAGAAWFFTRLSWLLVLAMVCAPPLLIRGALRPQAGPRILRWFFERCGGGYLKIGQLLASRYDLMPAIYCEELSRLFDDVRPVPAKQILRTVETSLGATVADLYSEFDPIPLATASLAQVHCASLPDGRPVVVKVLKPRIEHVLRIDIACFQFTARLIDALPVLRGLDVRALAAELGRSALEEVNLSREALNTSFIHRRMALDQVAHYAPLVHFELSSRRVLTMERIDGVTVREIISALHQDDQEQLAKWASRGITPQRTAVILIRSVLEQTMRFRSFNADPHPSNLIVSDGGTLNWVDFGLVGWLDERQWQLQIRLREAFVQGRVHEAYVTMLQSIEPFPEGRDLRAFEQEIKRAIRDYMLTAENPNASITERGTGVFLLRTLQALRRSRLPMTVSTLTLYRTILIADMVMLRLYPKIDWPGHLRRFLYDVSRELVGKSLQAPATSVYTAFRLARTPVALAEAAEWIVDRLPQLGRATLATLTLWQRLTLTVLRLLRALAILVVSVAVLGLVQPKIARSGVTVQLGAGIAAHPWPSLIIATTAFFIATSFIRQIESR